MWGLLLGFAGKHKQLLFEAFAVLGAVLLLWGWAARHYHDKYQPEIDAAHTERDQAKADLQAEQEAFKHAQEVSSDYQKQLAALRVTASAPPPVSLRCHATKTQLPAADTASGHSSPPAAAGVLPEEDGFDIADPTIPAEQLADEADRLAEQLRACQAFSQ